MAEWRISDETPLRELNGLDHERCAALHNYIVELGWIQRGLALDTLDKRTWWECYGGDAALASTTERMDTSVVAFLKAAWQWTQPQKFTFSIGIWRACAHQKNFGEMQCTLKTRMIRTNSVMSRFTWRIGRWALLTPWDLSWIKTRV
jgi:hypothetical protein